MTNTENHPLARQQKETIGLLSIGTFLEYFDLMLYVHMAVLLNELFFPKTDPFTTHLLSGLLFCTTFFFRPIGALFFGYIGDRIGRKATVIITTIIMAISCFIMANVPTYAEIGVAASITVIICRIMQGMSSMAEIIGAFVYITETIQRPSQYVGTAILALMAGLGGFAALGVIKVVTILQMDWRIAFWVGVLIALVGFVARTALRETPEFIDAKLKLTKIAEQTKVDKKKVLSNASRRSKESIKTLLAAFFIECPWPICFYIAFVYAGDILKINFNYSATQIVDQNFYASIAEVLGILPLIFLARYFYPILILKVRLVIFLVLMVISYFFLEAMDSPYQILVLQIGLMFFVIDTTPAKSIIIRYFSVLNRFTYAALMYALSRMAMYTVTAFGLPVLIRYFGNTAIYASLAIVLVAYYCSLLHFEHLEKESGNYPQK